jgi:hypothetical protein
MAAGWISKELAVILVPLITLVSGGTLRKKPGFVQLAVFVTTSCSGTPACCMDSLP